MYEYELDFDKKPVNLRFIALIIFSTIVIVFLFYPMLNLKPDTITPIIQNQSVITKTEYITVMITPIPDGKLYYASEYEVGIRKIKRPFSFLRYGAIGYKDLFIHSNVYDYKVFNTYHWFNPTDYKYYEEKPINDKNKFVFVFFSIYSDDIIGDDTRFWIPKENMMLLQINDISYSPVEFVKAIRIKELEETYNSNDNSRVTAFNTNRMYSLSTEATKTAGETTESIDVLKGGISNKIDGYIIFEVPKNSFDSDMLFYCNFYSWGNGIWRLKPD